MKKSTIILIAAIGALILWAISGYNGLVEKDEEVKKVWADVEAAYQRRMDLVSQAVSIVKGAANMEKSILTDVIEARSKATSITLNVDSLDEESMAKFQQAQSQLSGSLSRLMAVSEQYPELKSMEGYLQLQSQVEGTENRINEVRKKYNATVKPYNVSVRRFPGNILAMIFGFRTKAEFQADPEASKAPKIEM